MDRLEELDMKRLFECLSNKFFEVPDGTLVNPFLNPKDIMSGLPWDILDGISIAAGQINPGVVSEIHVHPFISQVTVLLSGSLMIRMKDPCTSDPYYEKELKLPDVEAKDGFSTVAVLGSPGTFFQLNNSLGNQPARVLYICSPSYIFEPGATPSDPPVYDDAIPVGKDWEYLAKNNWNPPELSKPERSYAARHQAIQRLASRKRKEELDHQN